MKEKSLFHRSSHDNFWSDFWSENPYYVFTNTFKYDDEKLFLDKYVIVEENRTREIFNWIKCYEIDAITDELKESQLKVVEYYSDVAGANFDANSREIALVVKKDELK